MNISDLVSELEAEVERPLEEVLDPGTMFLAFGAAAVAARAIPFAVSHQMSRKHDGKTLGFGAGLMADAQPKIKGAWNRFWKSRSATKEAFEFGTKVRKALKDQDPKFLKEFQKSSERAGHRMVQTSKEFKKLKLKKRGESGPFGKAVRTGVNYAIGGEIFDLLTGKRTKHNRDAVAIAGLDLERRLRNKPITRAHKKRLAKVRDHMAAYAVKTGQSPRQMFPKAFTKKESKAYVDKAKQMKTTKGKKDTIKGEDGEWVTMRGAPVFIPNKPGAKPVGPKKLTKVIEALAEAVSQVGVTTAGRYQRSAGYLSFGLKQSKRRLSGVDAGAPEVGGTPEEPKDEVARKERVTKKKKTSDWRKTSRGMTGATATGPDNPRGR